MRREASVAEPEGHLFAVAREVGLGIVIARDGRVEWADALGAVLFDVADERELVGRTIDSLFEGPTEDRCGAQDVDLAAPSIRTAVGGKREVEFVRVRAASSRPTGCVEREEVLSGRERSQSPKLLQDDEELWVIRDVESSASLGDGLHELCRALHEANCQLATVREQLAVELLEREQLLSVVSHELRTPITVIRGYNNLLLSDEVGELNERQRDFLAESNRSCERLNRFVGDLLAACGEAGSRLSVECTKASLEPLVEGLVTFFRPLLEERDLSIVVDLAHDGVCAEFDPIRIEQVVTNLLSNAIRYSKPGTSVGVTSRLIARDGDGREEIEVAVSDTGPGVAPENRERIFEPYVRAGDDRSAEGLGLGLAICRRIIDAHDGTIRVVDQEGSGSRFAFTLPLQAEVN